MPKAKRDQPQTPGVGQKRPVSSLPVRDARWEERLREARLKREKALAARKAAAPASVDQDPLPRAQGDAAEEKTAPRPRAPVSPTTALNAVLLFAVSAGFGFGIVLGLGVLGSLGRVPGVAEATPRETSPPASSVATTRAALVAETADAQEPASAAVSTPVLPDLGVEPKLETSAAPFASSVRMPEPPDTRFAQVSLPRLGSPVDIVPRGSASPAVPSLPDDVAALAEEFPIGVPSAQFFIHAPTGVAEQRLRGYVSSLRDTGVRVAEIGRENFRVSTTHLRYYSPLTAETAKAVAADLGVEARDFSGTFLDEERIEIWIAGPPAGRGGAGNRQQKRFDSSTPPYDSRGANR